MSTMNYVAIAPECGCIRAMCVDMPEYAKDTAKDVGKWIKAGYNVKRVTHEEMRAGLYKECPINPCPNPRNTRKKESA